MPLKNVFFKVSLPLKRVFTYWPLVGKGEEGLAAGGFTDFNGFLVPIVLS